MADHDTFPVNENRDDPREKVNSAEVHGDSDGEFEDDHDVTNPSNDAPEEQVNDLLGGDFPLR